MSKIPSIAMIPSGYKASNLYTVLPTDGTGDFNTSRASVATRVNENGLLEEVASNVPRLDYSVGGCPSLLLENSSTNLIPYSEDFSDASWTSASGGVASVPVVTSNQGISPDGTLNADRIVFNLNGGTSSGDISIIEQGVTLVGINVNTRSVYLKSNTGLSYDIMLGTNTSASTLEKITVTTEWQRFEVTQTPTTTSTNFYFGLRNVSGLSGLSDSADVLVYGASLEDNYYATSYIKTVGTLETRVADTATGSGSSAVINSSEGVLYAETKGFTNLSTQSNYIQLSKKGESSATNSLIIQHRSNGFLRVYANGFDTADIHFIVDVDFTENHKIAVLYKLNGYKLFIDGVEQNLVGTPTQTVFSGLDDLSFDLRGDFSWNGSVKDLRVYTTALTDAELTTLTTI